MLKYKEVTDADYVAGCALVALQFRVVEEMVHIVQIQRVALAEVDFSACVMQGAYPFEIVETPEEFVHYIGSEYAAVRGVLAAETGADGIAE